MRHGEAGKPGHLAILVERAHAVGHHAGVAVDTFDDVAHAPIGAVGLAHFHVTGVLQILQLLQTQPGLFPGFTLQRLRHTVTGGHHAAHERVPQARVGGFGKGALLHPERALGTAADQVHGMRGNAQHARSATFHRRQHAAVRCLHCKLFIAPQMRHLRHTGGTQYLRNPVECQAGIALDAPGRRALQRAGLQQAAKLGPHA